MNYGKASCICIKHAVHVNNTGIFEPFSFLISVFSFCETHQRERKPPARSTGWHHSSQSCMPEQRKLERQQERACREKSAASHAMPVQLHRTTCHPMQPSRAILAPPVGKQRPLSAQSPVWSCRAEAICSSRLLAGKWPSLFLATALQVRPALHQQHGFFFLNSPLGPVRLKKGMKTKTI